MMPAIDYLYWRYVRLLGDERGATAVEYGVMVALIVAVIVLTVYGIGQSVLRAFQAVATQLTGAGW